MEGEIESIDIQEKAESSPCGVDPCGKVAAVEVETHLFCLNHFLSVSFQELRSRYESLRSQECDPAATAAFKEFLAVWARQADSLVEDTHLADQQTKSQLLEALLWVSHAGKSLRRSPRLTIGVPVWLRREDARRTWEEDTWTSTLSRHGAGFVCHHSVETGGMVVLTRKDKGCRATARVVYARMDSEGGRQIGVEIIDRDNFWD
ncbi:MAG: PilZ domain-containing protein [Candidatus Acidiferrales bacterium]